MMTPVTEALLAEIEAKSRAATPGPWRPERNLKRSDWGNPGRVVCCTRNDDITGAEDGEDGHQYIADVCGFDDQIHRNTEFIALLNPATALALVGEVRRLRGALEEIQFANFHGCLTGDCPHDKQAECDKVLAARVSELASIASEALREAAELGVGK